MRGKYTFTVSSLKVANDLWSLEFLSLGGPIPSDVVQFDDLVEPLADKPVFFQDVDPISYFRRLTQDVPTFLHGYHARVLNQIRSRLVSLEVGSCLHVKVSYLNSSAGINAYNYEIVLAKQIENQKLPGVAPTSIVESPQIIPTVSTEKEISVPADSIDQIQDKPKDYIVKLDEGMTIPEESTKIHGITNEKMRAEGRDIKEVLEIFINDFNVSFNVWCINAINRFI